MEDIVGQMELPEGIHTGLDFYDYCLIMSGAPIKSDCITIRLAHTRMKLDATYSVCRDEEDVLESIVSAVRAGKARILEVTFGGERKPMTKSIAF
jgi:hypothetical protein